MGTVCLESSALITFILREPGWHAVEAIIRRADRTVLPSPGLTEVIDRSRAKGNASTGPQIAAALSAVGVEFEPATETDLIEAADLIEMSRAHPGPADRRGRPATLSIADAMIIAAVQRLSVPVVTRDRYWSDLAKARLISAEVHAF